MQGGTKLFVLKIINRKNVIGETPSGDFPIFHKQFIDIYLKVISTLRVRIRVHRNLLRKLIKSRHE